MDFYETLARQQELQAAIKRLQAEERSLREGIGQGSFPEPEEGVNKLELEDGRTLKATYKMYRKVLEDKLAEAGFGRGFMGKLFRVKHELVTAEYRKLDEDTRKVVDAVLHISMSSLPTIEVVAAPPQQEDVIP